MAKKTGMRVVGVVENMTSEIFGEGGGERLATELGVPLLGSVPLDPELRRACDEASTGCDAGDRRDRGCDRREPHRRVHAHAAARLLMEPEEARPRLAALGFRPEDVETLAAHFLDAEARGSHGHGLSRIEWLETWGSCRSRRGRSASSPSRATSAGTATAGSAT